MLTGITARIHRGYTGHDHLIGRGDETAAIDAVAGRPFRRAADALEAARRAYRDACDARVRHARISVALRTARGDRVEVG